MRQIRVIHKYDIGGFEKEVNNFLKKLSDNNIDVDTIYLEYKYDRGNYICFIEWDE